MKYNCLILLIIFYLFIICRTYSQDRQIQFEHLSIEDGLSQSSVFSVVQDYRGFLWISTLNGVDRYDGYNFVSYKNRKKDSTSLSGNIVKCILQSRDSTLWIATMSNGLNKYLRNTDNFKSYQTIDNDNQSISNNVIVAMLEDSKGYLWLGTKFGLNKFNPKTGKAKRYFHDSKNKNSISNDLLAGIAQDKAGMIWIASENGLDCLNPDNDTFTHYTNSPQSPIQLISNIVLSVYIDSKDRIWIGTDSGLQLYDRQTNTSKIFGVAAGSKNRLCNRNVICTFEDSEGLIWIGTSDGLNIYNPQTDFMSSFQHDPNDSKSLGNNNIAGISEDNSGIVWVGTWERGLNKYDRRASKFNLYKYQLNAVNKLPDYTVRALYKDNNGNIWAGYIGGGLVCFNPQNNVFYHYLSNPEGNGLLDNTISNIYADRENNLWICTWNKGIHKVVFDSKDNLKIKRFINYSQNNVGLLSDKVQRIFQDSKGRFWIASNLGLDLFNADNKNVTHWISSGQDEANIQGAIEQDKDGYLWVGSWGGLYKINPDKTPDDKILYANNPKDSTSLSDSRIISLCIARDGTVWAGTFAGGLNRIKANSNGTISCSHYDEDNGLANNVVYAIFEDQNGNIWASTNKGISNLNPHNGKIINYDESDGLQSNEFFWGAGAMGKDGEILFGGIKGINTFYPEAVKQNTYIPHIVLTGFKLFNINVTIGTNSILKKSISESEEIVLTQEDKVVSFEFSALHFNKPMKNRYAYKLEGFNDDWIYTSAKKREITYTNLDPGTYYLVVKGTNSDQVWNETGVRLKIIVLPPFWKTLWFTILWVSFIIIGTFTFYKIRINSVKKQKLMLEDLVSKRTFELIEANSVLEIKQEEITQQNEEIIFQKNIIERSHKNITDSISYAKRIQTAVLPSQEMINLILPQHFILFKPRDIVSGDFYFVKQIKNITLLAVADCTGHGVSGAFMSMLGLAILNEIVRKQSVTNSAQVLNELRNQIKQALQQTGVKGEQQDGMDIAFCAIDLENYSLSFAGAHNPCWIFRSEELKVKSEEFGVKSEEFGGKESKLLTLNSKLLTPLKTLNSQLLILEPDYMPVGVYAKERPFNERPFQLQTNDVLYLFSDGYHSQFGGDKKLPLKSKYFKEILSEICNLPMNEQKQILENKFNEWRGTNEQTDDVLVLSVRI